MHPLIEKIIKLQPYRVDISVSDYQDEGHKLDIFIWETLFELLDSDVILKGDPYLLKLSAEHLYKLLLDRGIDATYDRHIACY